MSSYHPGPKEKTAKPLKEVNVNMKEASCLWIAQAGCALRSHQVYEWFTDCLLLAFVDSSFR
jgi:hypothetical protein